MMIKKIIFLAVAFTLLLCFDGYSIVKAKDIVNILNAADGTYNCSYEIGGTSEQGKGMISTSFKSDVVIEKIDGMYYMYLTQKQAQYLVDMKISQDGKQKGYIITYKSADLTIKTYLYTFGSDDLKNTISVSAYVTAMKTDVMFTLELNLEEAVYISSTYDTSISERPAEYVPIISLSVDVEEPYNYKQGEVFIIPSASAKIGTVNCNIEVSAYYFENGTRKQVLITNNSFTLNKTGIYYFVYTATTDNYKTSLGNSSKTELEFIINSSSDGGSQGNNVYTDKVTGIYVEDISGAVSGFAKIKVTHIVSEEIIDNIEKQLKKNKKYKAVEILLTDSDDEKIDISKKVKVSIIIPETYNKAETEIFFTNGTGTLVKTDGVFYGNSFVFETDSLGIFILAETEKSTKMQFWVIALIVTCAALLTLGIIYIVVSVKKRNIK